MFREVKGAANGFGWLRMFTNVDILTEEEEFWTSGRILGVFQHLLRSPDGS